MTEVPEELDVEYVPELLREVLVKIFSGLAGNSRSVRDLCAAASVCPSWREAAKESSLWRVLVMSYAPLNARLTGARLRNLVARSRNTLTRLWLHSCPLVNDTALALSLQQQPCLICVDVEDCALVTRPGLAYALCDSEDFMEIVEQLNDPRQSAEDAQRCCVALFTLGDAKEAAASLADAPAAGARDALLRCVVLHAAHAGVQAACCNALARYVHLAFRTEVAFSPPIFQAVVAALKAHPLDVNVQRAALLALCVVCCFGLVGTPGVPALLDAIQPVLAAMRAFPTDLELQTHGCTLLVKMCNMDASVAEAVATAGAMGLFIKALNFDLTKDTTSAVKAIGAIALAPAALPQASAGIVAVIRTLRRHESSAMIAAATCMTLGIYLRCPATRERALYQSADFVIKAAAAAHNKDAAVKKAAKDALQDPVV